MTETPFRVWRSSTEGLYVEGEAGRIHHLLGPQGLPGLVESRGNGIAEDCLPADVCELRPVEPPATQVARLESELRVARAGEAFGKVAVRERDAERAAHEKTRAALESTQRALVEMEKKRDAWKEAAGVEYRDLDVSPAEQALLVRQWQGATQYQVHKAGRLAEQREAVLALLEDPGRWATQADLFAAIKRVFEPEPPPDKTWCPRCVRDASGNRYCQESSTQFRCLRCHAVLVVPDPPIGSVPA